MGQYTATYKSTYTTFSGADIVATFDGNVVGELQAISYSVTREKTPIYTMGSPDPRSFSRGKRGIAGSMVFTVFNKDALAVLKTTNEANSISTAYANTKTRGQEGGGLANVEYVGIDKWETLMNERAKSEQSLFANDVAAYYADEVMPFDITITLKNEYGQAAKFSLLACEILNEGSGMSIDDISTEKACTFVARGISHLTPIVGADASKL